jgi:NSS family neurotransmitter:Na+ symporter
MTDPASTPSARGAFGSRVGFILAAAGSAVGLGNIWRFPYTAGENGGAAFVLVYLGFVVLCGVPVLLAELALGRHSKSNPVGAFEKIAPGTPWRFVGGLGVLTGFGILAFYSVVAGWTLSYLGRALAGTFGGAFDAEQSEKLFGAIISDPFECILTTAAFLVLTGAVVRGGVGGGIERAAKVLMPMFFVLLVVLAGRSLTLPGAAEGVRFLFHFDLSELSGTAVMSALGQALFSLSLGMGAMITYGSYLSKRENLAAAGLAVAAFDTTVAVLAGLIVFPALFSTGQDPSAGPGLVFQVLPGIFHSLPAGNLFAIAFYALLGIAALTSTISLLEVVVAYFVDERRWSRERAVWTIVVAAMVLAIPSALSQGASDGLSKIFAGKSFLDLQNIVWGNLSLSIGALLIAVFVAWRWGVDRAEHELSTHASGTGGSPALLLRVWSGLVRFVCPIAIAAVLVYLLATGEFF